MNGWKDRRAEQQMSWQTDGWWRNRWLGKWMNEWIHIFTSGCLSEFLSYLKFFFFFFDSAVVCGWVCSCLCMCVHSQTCSNLYMSVFVFVHVCEAAALSWKDVVQTERSNTHTSKFNFRIVCLLQKAACSSFLFILVKVFTSLACGTNKPDVFTSPRLQ